MVAGLSSYTYTWAVGVPGTEPDNPMTVPDLIRKAAALEVPVLQLADNIPLDKYSEDELHAARDSSLELNIQIEVGARGMTRENLDRYIDLARFFSSPILRFVIDGPGFEPGIPEIHAVIEAALPKLEAGQIILAIENHDRLLSAEFEEVVKTANSPFVGICLDSVNSIGAGEGLESVIDRLAPYTVNLHVKEFMVKRVTHKMGFVVEGCPLGEGMLPLREIIGQLPHTCGSAILEQWTPPESTIEETIRKEARWAEKSIVYLKEILI